MLGPIPQPVPWYRRILKKTTVSEGHWIILLTVLLVVATLALVFFAWRGSKPQRPVPDLVQAGPPSTSSIGSGLITDATFIVRNVGTGTATTVTLFAVVRNADGTWGAQGVPAFQAPLVAPGEVITIQAKVGNLGQTNPVNLWLAGSCFDHTGSTERVYRIPSDSWMKSWMRPDWEKRRKGLSRRSRMRARLPW